jgi:enoyl reductase-like protein
VNRKELSAVVAECAARTERAAALADEARAKQEAAIARQEAATARLNEIQAGWVERDKKQDAMLAEMKSTTAEMKSITAEMRAKAEEDRVWRQEALRCQEKMFQDYLHRADQTLAETKRQTVEIIAELRDQRDERRALKEAILKLIDRLPPPPPHLRSA